MYTKFPHAAIQSIWMQTICILYYYSDKRITAPRSQGFQQSLVDTRIHVNCLTTKTGGIQI